MKYSLRLLSLAAAGVLAAGLVGSARGESGRRANALVGNSYVFPSVANTQGLFNAFFKTKVTLYNPNTSRPLWRQARSSWRRASRTTPAIARTSAV